MSWCRSPCECCVLCCFRHHPERFLGLAWLLALAAFIQSDTLGPCWEGFSVGIGLIASTFSIVFELYHALASSWKLGCQDTWCTPPRCSSDLQRVCSGSPGRIIGKRGWGMKLARPGNFKPRIKNLQFWGFCCHCGPGLGSVMGCSMGWWWEAAIVDQLIRLCGGWCWQRLGSPSSWGGDRMVQRRPVGFGGDSFADSCV